MQIGRRHSLVWEERDPRELRVRLVLREPRGLKVRSELPRTQGLRVLRVRRRMIRVRLEQWVRLVRLELLVLRVLRELRQHPLQVRLVSREPPARHRVLQEKRGSRVHRQDPQVPRVLVPSSPRSVNPSASPNPAVPSRRLRRCRSSSAWTIPLLSSRTRGMTCRLRGSFSSKEEPTLVLTTGFSSLQPSAVEFRGV